MESTEFYSKLNELLSEEDVTLFTTLRDNLLCPQESTDDFTYDYHPVNGFSYCCIGYNDSVVIKIRVYDNEAIFYVSFNVRNTSFDEFYGGGRHPVTDDPQWEISYNTKNHLISHNEYAGRKKKYTRSNDFEEIAKAILTEAV